jgi:pSer/pThr/pTyr-binding forkhead associated (FHA) protein
MSWKLRRDGGDNSAVYYLIPTSTCKVGRQGCQIIISDTTVSRHHADIDIDSDTVKLRDVSKFVQTAVNGKLLSPSDRVVNLRDKDVLTFGACTDIFTLENDPFVLVSLVPDSDILASKSGIVLTSQLGSNVKGLVVRDDSIDHMNPIVIEALLQGIPLINMSFLTAMSHCPSGSTQLPSIEDHRASIPKPGISRSKLFQTMTFVLFGDVSSSVRRLVSLAGGFILDNLDGPLADVYIINDSNSQPVFEFKMMRVRTVGSDLLRRAIWEGSASSLECTVHEDIQPRRADVNTAGTGWISTQTRSENCIPSSAHYVTEAASQVPNKKFKKAHILRSDDTFVPLQDWKDSSALRPSNFQNVILRKPEDEIDDWMRSTNSQ